MNTTSKRKTKRKISNESASGLSRLAKSCGIGFLFATGSALILSFILALICTGRKDPASLTRYFSVAALGLSAFIGGAVASKFYKSSHLLPAIITACLEMLFFFILSFLLPSDGDTSWNGFIPYVVRATVILLAALGGSLGERKISHRSRRKRSPSGPGS